MAQTPRLRDDSPEVMHLDETRSGGITPSRLRHLVQSGRWQSPYPRVYVTLSGPIPPATMEQAAVLYAGAGAALSHWSAGAKWRLCPPPSLIHVAVPFARVVVPQPGLVVHRSRTLSEAGLHPALHPRRTRIERTVIDLLASKLTAESALGLVADAMREKRTTAAKLRIALDAAPMTRWRKLVLAALPDVDAGAHSVLELRELKVRRKHGLPDGSRQSRRDAHGVEYADILTLTLLTELDGRLGHDRATEIWRDFRRDNRGVLGGRPTLRYGWADIADHPCEVAIQQAVMLRRLGWTGRFRRCAGCPASLPCELASSPARG